MFEELFRKAVNLAEWQLITRCLANAISGISLTSPEFSPEVQSVQTVRLTG